MSIHINSAVPYLITLLLVVSLGSTSSQSYAGDENTQKLDEYGIELTLPDDWKVEVLNKRVYKKGKLMRLVKASNQAATQMFDVYARKVKGASVEKWFRKGLLPRYLKWYSQGYEHTFKKKSEVKVKLATGEVVPVEYYQVFIASHSRQAVFSYFAHRDNYILIATANMGQYHQRNSLVEEKLLPGISLF